MYRWFGERYELNVLAFEAGGEHVRDARAELGDRPGLALHHIALVGPDHEGDVARLYKTYGGGKADSLLRDGGEDYEDVPARRLTTVLADAGWDLRRTPAILRMNIEGAEQFVIADLLEAGLTGSVDGYYGLWDDLSKIDAEADRRFQRLLSEHGIETLAFNDRDLVAAEGRPRLSPRELPATLRRLAFALRRRVIREDIDSAFRAGLARTGSAGASA